VIIVERLCLSRPSDCCRLTTNWSRHTRPSCSFAWRAAPEIRPVLAPESSSSAGKLEKLHPQSKPSLYGVLPWPLLIWLLHLFGLFRFASRPFCIEININFRN
jgi:hypothetical protein